MVWRSVWEIRTRSILLRVLLYCTNKLSWVFARKSCNLPGYYSMCPTLVDVLHASHRKELGYASIRFCSIALVARGVAIPVWPLSLEPALRSLAPCGRMPGDCKGGYLFLVALILSIFDCVTAHQRPRVR